MNKIILCCIMFGLYFSSEAQTSLSKIAFSSINNAGLLIGEGGNAFAIQSKNGIQKGKWFAGVGAGFDFYGKRTIPLFLSVQKDFLNKPKRPFVYADGGVNFRWLDSNDPMKDYSKSTPGLYCEGGVGWKVQFKNSTALLFSAGYSFKQVKEKTPSYWLWSSQGSNEEYDRYNYKYRRIVIRLGLQL